MWISIKLGMSGAKVGADGILVLSRLVLLQSQSAKTPIVDKYHTE